MVQGTSQKKSINRPVNKKLNSAKVTKQVMKSKKQTPRARGVTLPGVNNRFREEAEMDRKLTQAINKSNEQKVAARLIQSGNKIATTDILQKGKELSKKQRRDQVKKKVSRVEEKLQALHEAAEKSGKI
jgi:imidazoleglycerol phosphate synthase glutamine amidotransferase subunit HisH